MKDLLVCIDSDGCAIDSMECKHRRCFGPFMVEVWHLEAWKAPLLERWNRINLYSMTRGINRFLGLEMILREVDETCCRIDGLGDYSRWCGETATFSNAAVQEQIDRGAHPIFAQVLDWSNRVNRGVGGISDQIKPFDGVAEALNAMAEHADIAIVSSANPQAVREEWTRFGLMPHVAHVMAQDAGTKADCIARLLQMGYAADRVMMIGDAPGDQTAAEKNGVLYYPILAGQEVQSWQQWLGEGWPRFRSGAYTAEYQGQQLEKFRSNLTAHS